MPFKVRCRLIAFMGDVERFPCHFDYKIGDEITYNGEKFEGRICHGVMLTMAPVILETMNSGNKAHGRLLLQYSGNSTRDPDMKKYDGVGFRPLKEPPPGVDKKFIEGFARYHTKLAKGRTFVCTDSRTSALFLCEPIGLADGGDKLPYYNREMSIPEKIKNEPGLTADEIINKFSDWERNEIYPPLNPINVRLMLDELVEVDYVDLRDEKAYPKNPLAVYP